MTMNESTINMLSNATTFFKECKESAEDAKERAAKRNERITDARRRSNEIKQQMENDEFSKIFTSLI